MWVNYNPSASVDRSDSELITILITTRSFKHKRMDISRIISLAGPNGPCEVQDEERLQIRVTYKSVWMTARPRKNQFPALSHDLCYHRVHHCYSRSAFRLTSSLQSAPKIKTNTQESLLYLRDHEMSRRNIFFSCSCYGSLWLSTVFMPDAFPDTFLVLIQAWDRHGNALICAS